MAESTDLEEPSPSPAHVRQSTVRARSGAPYSSSLFQPPASSLTPRNTLRVLLRTRRARQHGVVGLFSTSCTSRGAPAPSCTSSS